MFYTMRQKKKKEKENLVVSGEWITGFDDIESKAVAFPLYLNKEIKQTKIKARSSFIDE